MSPELTDAARELVTYEGWLLDQREWDAWIALYAEDAEYWLPCWDDEFTLTDNPNNELSLIYYGSRAGLEDRIFRLRTERSLASTPLPRTCHMINIAKVSEDKNGAIVVHSNWTTHAYRLSKAHSFFGQQTHTLRIMDGELKIAKRKIVVANDRIPNVLDIYSV